MPLSSSYHFASLQELQDFLTEHPLQALGFGPTGLAAWQEVLEAARPVADQVALAKILFNLGWCCFNELYVAQPEQGLAYHQQALAHAQQAGDAALQGRVLSALATIWMYLGQYEQAMDNFSQALQLAQSLGHTDTQFVLLNNMADFHDQVGNDFQALEQHHKALELAYQSGRAEFILTSKVNLMNSLLKLGRLPEAQVRYHELQQELSKELWLWLDFAEVGSRLQLEMGHYALAQQLSAEGLALTPTSEPPRLHLELQITQMQALVALGELAQAGALLEHLNQEDIKAYSLALYARYKLGEVQVLEAQGHPEQALSGMYEYLKVQQLVRQHNLAAQAYSTNMNSRVMLLEREAEIERLHNQELRRANEQLQATQTALEQQARYDALTGLVNRAYFHQQTAAALADLKDGEQVALIFLDLDNFKAINDLYGHGFGDELLRQVAQRLRQVAQGQTIGRMGGDEFVVLVQGQTTGGAEALAQQILAVLAEPYNLGGHRIENTASVGIAFAPAHSLDANMLQQQADLAMYTTKRQQPGRVLRYLPEMSTDRERQLRLEQELRGAPQRGELVLYYQGRFAVAHSLTQPEAALEGFEALVRWQHPELGLLAPQHFIPLAEQSGLILTVGEWVMEEACRQARAWNFNENGLSMSLNVSALQFEQEDFVERVRQLLEQTGLIATRLLLEVTETLILRDLERAKSNISQLHELGVQVTMDDFGTGYSSLSVLQTLPLNHLKIDRSFVQRLSTTEVVAEAHPGKTDEVRADQTARVMLKSIVDLAHQLQMQVTAEGIETSEQLAFLHQLGCDHAQGYFLGRPQNATETQTRFGLQTSLGVSPLRG